MGGAECSDGGGDADVDVAAERSSAAGDGVVKWKTTVAAAADDDELKMKK